MTGRRPGDSKGRGLRLRREAFPALREFVRGYLHEDFPEVHGSVRAAAAAFAGDASLDERRALATELESLIEALAGRSLAVLRRVLTETLGGGWRIESREQLQELLDVVRPPAGE